MNKTDLWPADSDGEVACGWHDYEGRCAVHAWPEACLTATNPNPN